MRSPRRPRVCVLRDRQTEIRPQGCSLVFPTVQAAASQFGNYLVDEIVERPRKIRRQQIEAVGSFADKPVLQFVADLPRGALDQKMLFHRDSAPRHLSERQVLASRQPDIGGGGARLRRIALRIMWW